MRHVAPDKVSVYAGSALGQLDQDGTGGLLGSRYRGGRPTSKQVPMGLAEMPADFVNAYLLGSVGQTGHNMGACATFLYNLRHGMFDIQSGRSRVALVGGAEAPLCPDVIEGLSTMGALGTDQAPARTGPPPRAHANRTCAAPAGRSRRTADSPSPRARSSSC